MFFNRLRSQINRLLYQGDKYEDLCRHWAKGGPMTVVVRNHELKLRHSPMCKDCTERYLNLHSTTCGVCKEPITPGTPIGAAPANSGYAWVHYSTDCSIPGCYVGTWGEGKVIPAVYECNEF